MIKYKIIEIHPEQHSIVVRFYSDLITEGSLATQWSETGEVLRGRTDYNIDLPVPSPEGAALVGFISAHAPVEWLGVQEKLLDPVIDTSMTTLIPLVGVEGMVLDLTPSTQGVPQISVATMPVQEPVPVPTTT